MRADLLEVKDRMEERWLELQFKIRGTAVELWEKTWTKKKFTSCKSKFFRIYF